MPDELMDAEFFGYFVDERDKSEGQQQEQRGSDNNGAVTVAVVFIFCQHGVVQEPDGCRPMWAQVLR